MCFLASIFLSGVGVVFGARCPPALLKLKYTCAPKCVFGRYARLHNDSAIRVMCTCTPCMPDKESTEGEQVGSMCDHVETKTKCGFWPETKTKTNFAIFPKPNQKKPASSRAVCWSWWQRNKDKVSETTPYPGTMVAGAPPEAIFLAETPL